jgi:hypothetical protein
MARCIGDRVKNIKLAMFNHHATFTSHSNSVKVVEAYWTNDKPIYLAFKLPKYVLQYHHMSKNNFFNISY